LQTTFRTRNAVAPAAGATSSESGKRTKVSPLATTVRSTAGLKR
jgi:hypothetical protein